MKNMLKILGIVLTLAMLSGLLMAVAPVSTSAANLSWSNYGVPTMSVGTNANVYAFSGDGKTIYLWTNGTVNSTITSAVKLYKSTDNGATWSNSGLDTTTPAVISASTVTITALAVNPANNNDIVAVGIDTAATYTYAGYHVYRSINAGQTFYAFDPFTPGTSPGAPALAGYTINSIDIANGSSGLVSILIGYSGAGNTGGAALFDSSVGTWRYTGITTGTAALGSGTTGGQTWGTSGNALAVKFSPNYTNDAAILAVSANGTTTPAAGTGIYLKGMIVANNSDWNASGAIKDTQIKQGGALVTAVTANQIASLALPSDFVPTSTVQNRVFVGIGDLIGDNSFNANDVYRINGSPNNAGTCYSLGAGVNVYSIAYAGTASAGQLAVGQVTGNSSFPTGSPVISTNQVTSNTPTWNTSANSPSGVSAAANTVVDFLPASTATAYTLFAGTAGNYSELATSTDLNAFWGIGLFNVPASSGYGSVVLGGSFGRGTPTVWQVVRDNTGPSTAARDTMLFYSTDGGTTWKKILDNGFPAVTIKRSPAYATDKTIYLIQTQNTNTSIDDSKQIVKTSDGGLTWNLLNTPGNVSAIDMSAIDANSYWVMSIDRIQNSSSSTYATIEGKEPAIPSTVQPGFFVVPTKSGEFYLSTDNGVTFNRLGNVAQFNSLGGNQLTSANLAPPYTTDVPAKTIYAVDLATHNIMKWTVGTDSSWQIYLNSTSLPVELQGAAISGLGSNHPISSISKGADGNWYIVSNNNYDNVGGVATQNAQIWYTSDLLNNTFTPLLNSSVSGLGGTVQPPYGAGLAIDANKNSAFYVQITQADFNTTTGATTTKTAPASPNGYPNAVMTFTNTLSVAPKTTAPADKASNVGTPQSTSSGTFVQVNFSWTAASYNNPKYDFQVAFDNAFNNIASASNNAQYNTYASATATTGQQQSQLDLKFIPSNGVAAVPLSPGQTYYWRVRVSYPVFSTWSAAQQFSTAVVSSTSGGIDQTGRISPANGATAVPLTPAITWGTVPGATGYDFAMSTDPTFADASKQVDSFTNKNATVYTPSKALAAGTTYFWRVRALNGTAAGDWVTSAFTTAAGGTGPAPSGGPAPVVTPIITVTVPTQAVPTITVVNPAGGSNAPQPTPAYIWVIIAIGAVLVIAVIVLIARTRRV
jgi:trimeric autotransporter adhesin